jgi:hypothetical protein
LEPVANYLAARFVQAETATRKVQGIAQVLQYHCLHRGEEGLRIEFGLLGGWLTRSRDTFKDETAFDVLCAVLRQFADRHDAVSSPGERRDLHSLLTNWLSVLTWKFKALDDDDLFERVKSYADQVAPTTRAVEALGELGGLEGEDSLAQACRRISRQLRNDTADLPYLARMAVGVKARGRQ